MIFGDLFTTSNKVIRADENMYLAGDVALLVERSEDVDKTRKDRYSFFDDPSERKPESPYLENLHALGLNVVFIPADQINTKRSRRRLDAIQTIVAPPELAKHLDTFVEEKEKVIIATIGKPISSSKYPVLEVDKYVYPLREGRKIYRRVEPQMRDFSDALYRELEFGTAKEPITDNETLDILFKYGTKNQDSELEDTDLFGLHDSVNPGIEGYFGKVFVTQGAYTRLLKRMYRETLSLEEVIKEQERISDFAAIGTEKLGELGKYISTLNQISDAIRTLSEPISNTVQRHRNHLGMFFRYMSDEKVLKEITDAINDVHDVELPVGYKIPKIADDIIFAKIIKGISNAADKDNPNGFPAFLKEFRAFYEKQPEDYDAVKKLLAGNNGEKKELHDFVAKYLHAASYIKLAAGWLDFYRGMADLVLEKGWSIPQILPAEEGIVSIEDGFYPFMNVDKIISNPTYLDRNVRIELISGSNSNGKTIYAIQVPTIQICAQKGLPVPAKNAKISMMDGVLVRLKKKGIERNEGALMTEIIELNKVLSLVKQHGNKALISLDEYFMSTDSVDGESLLYGYIEGVLPSGAKMIVTHHYPTLGDMSLVHPEITNSAFIPEFKDDGVKMTYKKVPNTVGRSHGIEIAAKTLPKEIIENATKRKREKHGMK